MQITVDLDDAELAHTLDALSAVVDVIEQRSDQLVAAVVLRNVVAKLLRAVEEAS